MRVQYCSMIVYSIVYVFKVLISFNDILRSIPASSETVLSLSGGMLEALQNEKKRKSIG
jgi:hypothetical protein